MVLGYCIPVVLTHNYTVYCSGAQSYQYQRPFHQQEDSMHTEHCSSAPKYEGSYHWSVL